MLLFEISRVFYNISYIMLHVRQNYNFPSVLCSDRKMKFKSQWWLLIFFILRCVWHDKMKWHATSSSLVNICAKNICARAKDLKFFDDLSSMWAQKNMIHNNNSSLYVCISFCIVPKDVTRDLKELLSLGLTHVMLNCSYVHQGRDAFEFSPSSEEILVTYTYVKNEKSFLKRSSNASNVVVSLLSKRREFWAWRRI